MIDNKMKRRRREEGPVVVFPFLLSVGFEEISSVKENVAERPTAFVETDV